MRLFLVFLFALLIGPSPWAQDGVLRSPEGFRLATEPWPWQFPRDLGPHPEFQTEWWYYTGNLNDESGNRFGFQLVVFRRPLVAAPAPRESAWATRDVYLAHLAVTDVEAGTFSKAQRLSRTGPGLAGAQGDPSYRVWLLDWEITDLTDGSTHLKARDRDFGIDLRLRPAKPMILHGNRGLSQKGPGVGNASHYYSFTRLDVLEGSRVWTKSAGPDRPIAVRGSAWKDHEFSTSTLAENQVGWDWFSLQFDNNTELMLFHIRLRDGGIEPHSHGTFVAADGSTTEVALEDFRLETLDRWKSPRSGAEYPSRWRLLVPKLGLDVTIAPVIADQELDTSGTAGVIYYEGAVDVSGTTAGNAAVTGVGYVEMTGYARALDRLF